MSKIISIGTAVPPYKHRQEDILHFMQHIYAMNEVDKRKLKFLYHQSGIQTRYSVIPDYSKTSADEWKFYPPTENLEPFPSLELRMQWYNRHAGNLSVDAIRNCIDNHVSTNQVTHLITVSCTGMSAPGLDLHIMELMDLPRDIYRTSVNFMGCYAAIHGLKMADAICKSDENAKVIVVCTELCTLHFQKQPNTDNISSSLLFADGSAAALVMHDAAPTKGWHIDSFYSEIVAKGKKDMAWELSQTGFLMTLSGYIPALIEQDFHLLLNKALEKAEKKLKDIGYWCIHPGGKRILEAVEKTCQTPAHALQACYDVLKEFGNMSSPSILFILKRLMQQRNESTSPGDLFCAAFGPGLTMETFLLSQPES